MTPRTGRPMMPPKNPVHHAHPVGLLFLACIVTAACANVRVTPHDPVSIHTLKPTIEDKDAGLVGIRPNFALSSYRVIAVDRFILTANVTDEDDKVLAQTMPAYLQTQLVRRLRESGLFERVIDSRDGGGPAADEAGLLKLQGTITGLTGGSRALRFWIGFGAGRSRVQVETRFVDAQSEEVLLVTADRHVAAISDALSLDYGGNSEHLVRESLSDMARDLVKFLVRLSHSQAPQAQ